MNQVQETKAIPLDVPPSTNEAGTIEIENLDTFVKLLTRWHSRKVKVLEHFLTLEGGIEMQVGEEESFKLEGDILKGMKAGVNLALMEFGNLPFAYETENAAANEPAVEAAPATNAG